MPPVPIYICSHCDKPLPPRPQHPGRPRLAHAGDCERKARNRRKLNARIKAFRDHYSLAADRSSGDFLPHAYDSEVRDESGRYLGFQPVDVDPHRGIWGQPLMILIDQHETMQRVAKAVRKFDRAELVARRNARPSPSAGMTDQEIDAAVKRAVARRSNRLPFG